MYVNCVFVHRHIYHLYVYYVAYYCIDQLVQQYSFNKGEKKCLIIYSGFDCYT